jgi:hypothetical protein
MPSISDTRPPCCRLRRPTWPLTGPGSSPQWEVGGGLSYELGRVQLEALYDYLLPAAEEPEMRRPGNEPDGGGRANPFS